MNCQQIANLVWKRIRSSLVFSLLIFLSFSFPVYAESTTIFTEGFSTPFGDKWQVVWNRQWQDETKPCMNKLSPTVWSQNMGKIFAEIDGPPCITAFAPTNFNISDVPKYTVNFRLQMYESTEMDRSFIFLWQDSANWYDVKFYGNSVVIQKVVNGQGYTLPGSVGFYPFQLNQEYPFSIEVTQQQRIVVKLGSQILLDVADQAPFLQTSIDKKIAFGSGVGARSRSVTSYDQVEVKSETSNQSLISLNVPSFKQTDPNWSQLEYDHARNWATVPTMNRWGCAVTSMAMILRYYGIDSLPSGENITPASLNQWLKDQVDGYISGNVNWLAVTRLTRLVSAKNNTPKLEFSRQDGNQEEILQLAKQDILAQKPVILGVEGHFFVADGVNSLANTLFIKDPAFSYSLLSQHVKEVLTIRRFQPSQTDLSYLFITLPADLEFEIKNDQGEVITTERTTEYLADPFTINGENSPLVQQVLIRKPETGRYYLQIYQLEPKPYSLSIYSYDVAGNVQIQEKTGEVGPEPQTIEIDYQKEEPSPTPTPSPIASPLVSPSPSVSPTPQPSPTIEPTPTPIPPQVSWQQLKNDIRELVELKQIKGSIITRYLEFLIDRAIAAPSGHHPQYLRFVEQVIKLYKPFIQKPAYNYLRLQLQNMKQAHETPSS
jgi:hypothetical protein